MKNYFMPLVISVVVNVGLVFFFSFSILAIYKLETMLVDYTECKTLVNKCDVDLQIESIALKHCLDLSDYHTKCLGRERNND